jgi:hypothetical protein
MWEGFQTTVYANKFPPNKLEFYNFVKSLYLTAEGRTQIYGS